VADLVYELERSSSSFDFLLEFVRTTRDGHLVDPRISLVVHWDGRLLKLPRGDNCCTQVLDIEIHSLVLVGSVPRRIGSLRIKVIESNTIRIKT